MNRTSPIRLDDDRRRNPKGKPYRKQPETGIIKKRIKNRTWTKGVGVGQLEIKLSHSSGSVSVVCTGPSAGFQTGHTGSRES